MDYYADTLYVHAKIHALKSALLSGGDYSGMIHSRKVLQYFPHIHPPADTQDFIQIKEILFHDQIRAILRLTAASRSYSGLFRAFLSIYELSNIKLVLMRLCNRRPLVEQWYDISPCGILLRSHLEEEMTAARLEEILSGTAYAGIIDTDEEPDYEILESVLDARLFRNFVESSGNFSREWKMQFLEVLVRKMTVIRIVWEQRFRVSYGWDDARIREHLRMFHLPRTLIPGAEVMAREAEVYFRRGMSRGYGRKESRNITEMETALERLFYGYVLGIFHKNFHSIYPVMAFLWLLYYQIRNLFVISEGIRYGLPSESIQGEIICEA